MVISPRVVHCLKFDKLHFAGWRAEQGFFRAFRLQFYPALHSSICAEVTILIISRSDWRGAERQVLGVDCTNAFEFHCAWVVDACDRSGRDRRLICRRPGAGGVAEPGVL